MACCETFGCRSGWWRSCSVPAGRPRGDPTDPCRRRTAAEAAHPGRARPRPARSSRSWPAGLPRMHGGRPRPPRRAGPLAWQPPRRRAMAGQAGPSRTRWLPAPAPIEGRGAAPPACLGRGQAAAGRLGACRHLVEVRFPRVGWHATASGDRLDVIQKVVPEKSKQNRVRGPYALVQHGQIGDLTTTTIVSADTDVDSALGRFGHGARRSWASGPPPSRGKALLRCDLAEPDFHVAGGQHQLGTVHSGAQVVGGAAQERPRPRLRHRADAGPVPDRPVGRRHVVRPGAARPHADWG
jgi:hypothetical protein